MSVVFNRDQVRSDFEKRCEAGDDENENRSTCMSVSDLLGGFNDAAESESFEESDISGAYQARGWTEKTPLSWEDIRGFMNDVVTAFDRRKERCPTLVASSVAEDTTNTEIYSRITERQKAGEFPFVLPDELSDVDKREEALLIVTLLDDSDKVSVHQYVHTECMKTMSKHENPTSSLEDSHWIYGNYFATLQRFLFLKCQKDQRFLHKWNHDRFVPLVSPGSMAEGESRVKASETILQVTETDIPAVDEALWKAWTKIETQLKALNADTCEPFVRFVLNEYFNILEKNYRETDKGLPNFPTYPYPISEIEPDRAQFQSAFQNASHSQKRVAEAFVVAEYKAFRSELDSETAKYLPQKPSDEFASGRYYKKLMELVVATDAPTTPKRRPQCEPVHITPQKRSRRTNTVTATDFYEISEITSSCKIGSTVHLRGHVLSVDDDVRNIESVNAKSGLRESSTVGNIILADASGIIKLALWHEQACELLPIFTQCNDDAEGNTCARVEVKNVQVQNNRQSVAGVRALQSTNVMTNGVTRENLGIF